MDKLSQSGMVNITYRSRNGSRCHQVSRIDITSCDCVVSQLLFHGPVHVFKVGFAHGSLLARFGCNGKTYTLVK